MTGNAPLVVIVGPTAVGKTAYAIETAQRLDGEIVNADSRQVYRHMDIGTAKPTPEQQAAATHHLIDIVDPDDNLTLAAYQRLAYATIDSIHARGRLPLLVGGTGQYVTAVIEGWTIPEVPPNMPFRAELEAYAALHGPEAVHQRLEQLDPTAAEKIDPRNLRRVIRAIEIVTETGQPMDYNQRRQPPPYDVCAYVLTLDRSRLYERADHRIDLMMETGFRDEVRRLLDMGYTRDLPSMSGLGYRELAAFLAGETTLGAALEATRRATRHFIRRQYTWFRGHDGGMTWLDVEATGPAAFAEIVADRLDVGKR